MAHKAIGRRASLADADVRPYLLLSILGALLLWINDQPGPQPVKQRYLSMEDMDVPRMDRPILLDCNPLNCEAGKAFKF